ncbi:LacI family DNA-binding transcriptional regulator [Microbacterium sp. PA5]|uniref:LacI family DNA-binding transcriptional regulator n=1 Tax=Microbacterium sp. PA5 TaxID=3416654 RepID=UPI003CF437BF
MSSPVPRVGMREVAAHAGVSTQTVSRVLNDHPHIRPETRARVLASASALGYRMNNAARALGTATTRMIGVVASDAALFGPAAGIAALEAAARAAGRWITTAYADGAEADAVADAVEHLLVQGVDGIAIVAPHTASLEQLERAEPGVPLVALHGGAGAERQAAGAALAIDHLVGLGHRRIAVLSGPEAWSEATVRARGVASALARHALTAAATWEGDWSAAAGAALGREVAAAVRAPGGPTAVAVANDQMALGLIAGLREAGVRVPADVSVTGFDDNPDAGFYLPALTTVRLDLAGEARRCIDELLGVETPATARPAELVIRSSSAAPAA